MQGARGPCSEHDNDDCHRPGRDIPRGNAAAPVAASEVASQRGALATPFCVEHNE